MDRELGSWYSPALGQDMPVVSYGHSGFCLLLVPTAAADYLEYERSCIDTYHSKLGGFSDSKIFSESLYNYEYFKTLNLAERQQKIVELLNLLKVLQNNFDYKLNHEF